MSQSPPSVSKLFVRSEVLAVIGFLNTLEDPSRQDRAKQIKRLQNIEDRQTVLRILVKELQRAANGGMIRIVSELLMELGTIEALQEPLWAIIQNAGSADEVKDAANVILRQLGDLSDPNLYLEYLDDPAGLINRETERMLEVSSRNPEALIDFIDFIFSLPADEQGNLIRSLQADYPVEYLLNIFLPAILALPPYETLELLLTSLGGTRSARAALFLQEHGDWFQADARLAKAVKKSVNALKIAGLYREDVLAEVRLLEEKTHILVTQSELYQCFATIPDGIGNQGIIISRERENGDVIVMSTAINDLHGVIDCFGFYELSKVDFQKLLAKFHEESTKIQVSFTYCVHKLRNAEALNLKHRFRIPYEYTCWKVLLNDPPHLEEQPPDTLGLCREWAHLEWRSASISLYHHPDFSTWFLEEGDHPVVTAILENVLEVCVRTMSEVSDEDRAMRLTQVENAFISTLDHLADAMIHGLLSSEWREVLTERLADSAWLLREQKASTMAALAATEVQKLLSYQGIDTPLEGFIKHYGRRCIEEDLLRLKQGSNSGLQDSETFQYLVDAVLSAWELKNEPG